MISKLKVKETVRRMNISIDTVFDTKEDININLIREYLLEKLEELEALSEGMEISIEERGLYETSNNS